MSDLTDLDHLARAVDLATANVTDGGGPFGAVLRRADGGLVEGVNQVTTAHDPTAHAEVMAIRTACAQRETHELPGAVLYASCEPCPMCLATALWARVDRVVFAAGRDDAARAGFDDATFHEYFETPGHHRLLPTEQTRTVQAIAPFEAWRAHERRIAY
ncbi:nucleoside deaminase [Brachybacterium sacelli]|uniref:Guanine deaminase n=1 Tax=Brachybacterium sacelli TaxID=173364 RepID=A0ABS4WZW0_9MICO|nr:nucleoside deaminase [Brachybacterium sacelli]MBP2381678.1 guanine deaminase [Brachybacterium sacelli]